LLFIYYYYYLDISLSLFLGFLSHLVSLHGVQEQQLTSVGHEVIDVATRECGPLLGLEQKPHGIGLGASHGALWRPFQEFESGMGLLLLLGFEGQAEG